MPVPPEFAHKLEFIIHKELEDLGSPSVRELLIIWEAFEYFDNFKDKPKF